MFRWRRRKDTPSPPSPDKALIARLRVLTPPRRETAVRKPPEQR